MALDATTLANNMLAAAKAPLLANWTTAEPFAKTQAANIAKQIVDIESQLLAKTITQDQASLLLDMQSNASRAALLAVEGIGIVAAQAAINAALAAVSAAVNTAVGFALL
jgi:hypothetical protein